VPGPAEAVALGVTLSDAEGCDAQIIRGPRRPEALRMQPHAVATLRHDVRVITQRSSSILKIVGCALVVVAGGALLWLPIHTQLMLGDWQAELKATGVPARAFVYDRIRKEGGNRESPSTTMYLRYPVGGRTHEAEVGCVQVCLAAGDQVSIWVNPADPSDFVTDFDQLSGHRGRLQGGLGVLGIGILAVGIPLLVSRFPKRRKSRRPATPVNGDGSFTVRSKHKRDGRR
jgi:hypothetical protein